VEQELPTIPEHMSSLPVFSGVLAWRSVLLVEETGVLEKTTDLSKVNDKLIRHQLDSNLQF
jgi:hypothetical protein